jgi:hypothetical protein
MPLMLEMRQLIVDCQEMAAQVAICFCRSTMSRTCGS